jgi:uncharacterized protein YndB with AHSA1/START domain
MQLLKRKKELSFDRTYAAPVDAVWRAWTDPAQLRQWWGPDKTTVPLCEVDLRVGGELLIVMEATEEMGKYAGTRWPMAGTFTHVEPNVRLTYDARSWTEGEEDATTITHVNDITMRALDGRTEVRLHVSITQIGPKAKMAAFGMKWGYKAQLDKLENLLTA